MGSERNFSGIPEGVMCSIRALGMKEVIRYWDAFEKQQRRAGRFQQAVRALQHQRVFDAACGVGGQVE